MHAYTRVLILAASLLSVSSSSSFAGMVESNLRCNFGSDSREVATQDSSFGDLAFDADTGAGVVRFFPEIAARIPEPVAKMEFASACLMVFGQPSDACTSVSYLRDNGLITSGDLQTLEQYYASVGSSDAWDKIKQIYACF